MYSREMDSPSFVRVCAIVVMLPLTLDRTSLTLYLQTKHGSAGALVSIAELAVRRKARYTAECICSRTIRTPTVIFL